MKILKLIILSSLMFFSAIVSIRTPVLAAIEGGVDCGKRTFLGILPAWDKYLSHEVVDGRCSPVINNSESILPVGLAVLEAMMSAAGVVAVVMVFWGAFNYVLTQGEPDKAAGARKTVINAAIGLVIVIVASRIVVFIGNTLNV